MRTRIIITVVYFFLFLLKINAQELHQVAFSNGGSLLYISFRCDQDLVVKMDITGKITEYGNPWERIRYDYYPGRLQPFPGRVDYYGAEADSASRGKIKSIGTTFISYYPMSETVAKAGKIRMFGRMIFDYYDNFDNPVFRGKIKMAGTTLLNYYSSFENESFTGKLKSAGNTSLSYYSSFDDKLIRGKVKTIGPYNYTWYTSNAGSGYQGSLQTGPPTPVINGVTYIIFAQ